MSLRNYFRKEPLNYAEWRSEGLLGLIVSFEKRKVLQALKIKEGDFILDAGSGDGFYAGILVEQGARVLGVDISRHMIGDLKKKNIDGVVADIEHLWFRRTFDKVLCAGAMEFLRNPSDAIKSFRNALRDVGVLVICYPRKSPFAYLYKLYHLLRGRRISLFSMREFEDLVADMFDIETNIHAGIVSAVIKCRKKAKGNS